MNQNNKLRSEFLLNKMISTLNFGNSKLNESKKIFEEIKKIGDKDTIGKAQYLLDII